MEHVGEARFRAVVDIRLAAYDLRDHGQTTDQGRDRVANADGEQVAVVVCPSVPGVDLIDGFCAEKRLEAPDQRKQNDVFQACSRPYTGEVRESQRTEHVEGDVDQQVWPQRVIPPAERIRLLLAKLEVHPQRDGDQ